MRTITTKITCIKCPLACIIEVKSDDKKNIISISTNCKQGKNYAMQEVVKPVRILTTTAKIISKDQDHPLLPVQTDRPIDKDMLKEVMAELSKIELQPPILYGEVIVRNILNTGANIIANCNILK